MANSPAQAVLAQQRAESRILWPLWIGIFAALILLLYGSILKALVLDWWTDPNYGHGFLVPVFSAFVLWRERQKLAQTKIKPSNFGLFVMLGAIGILLVGSLGAELFSTRCSLLILFGGIVLFLAELIERTEFEDCRPWAKRLIDSAATLGSSKLSPSLAPE